MAERPDRGVGRHRHRRPIEGPLGVAADDVRSASAIATYQRELEDRGVPPSARETVPIAVGQAMLPLAQSIIGWAGRPDPDPPAPRMAALREHALLNVAAWLSR